MSDTPVCPACGERAVWDPEDRVWETAHRIDCEWMRDPESEPYA